MDLTFNSVNLAMNRRLRRFIVLSRNDIFKRIKKVGLKMADAESSQLILEDIKECGELPVLEDDTYKLHFINNDILIVHKFSGKVIVTTDSVLDWMMPY